MVAPTFFLQVYAAFCYYDWHVSVDVALSVLVNQRDGDISVRDALPEGDSKDA